MITFLFLVVILGALVFLVEQYVPMPPPFRVVVRVVVLLGLAWYALALFGLVPAFPPR